MCFAVAPALAATTTQSIVGTALPGLSSIQALPSEPPRRGLRIRDITAPPSAMKGVRVWMYVSTASQSTLMGLGADPTSGARIWEYYLRQAELPFARISSAEDLAKLTPSDSVLLLPSQVSLTDAEKKAIFDWRDRGGSVLSTWLTGTHGANGAFQSNNFMQEVLDVEVAGNTKGEAADTFLILHGENPVAHTMAPGTRVWIDRLANQLPLRLVGKQEGAQILNWSRGAVAKKPSGLITYNERQMPSGKFSRVVTLGYPEQTWQRSDPRQLKIITDDVLGWLFREPKAYLGSWPHPYRSATLFAMQAAELVSHADVGIAKAIADMGGTMTCYVMGENVGKAVGFVKQVAAMGHEISYLGDVFEGFRGQPAIKQAERLDLMRKKVADAGIEIREPMSFSAPMDSYDANTQVVLAQQSADNYLAFMEVTESQVPFIAKRPAPPAPRPQPVVTATNTVSASVTTSATPTSPMASASSSATATNALARDVPAGPRVLTAPERPRAEVPAPPSGRLVLTTAESAQAPVAARPAAASKPQRSSRPSGAPSTMVAATTTVAASVTATITIAGLPVPEPKPFGSVDTVVLPRTLIGPEEAAEEDADDGLQNFMRAYTLNTNIGGLAVVRMPAQSLLMPDQRKEVLDHIASYRTQTWIASAAKISQWWRDRSQVSLKQEKDDKGMVLTAVVAKSQPQGAALSIWVDAPQRDSRVRVEVLEGQGAAPNVLPVTPGRMVLVWPAPVAGTYRWRIHFDPA